MKKVLFTGGGSVGHVSVNIALIPVFKKNNYKISYIGSKKGIEKEMIRTIDGVDYFEISTGKLRRYFSLENFIDIFKVIKGIVDSLFILKKIKPDFIFSKGGFVSVPVCIAAKILKIPTILHESDLTPGLANKINIKFSKFIFTTFKETLKFLPPNKSKQIGVIVREKIYSGNKEKAYSLLKSKSNKPTILVIGGSLGSKVINEYIWNNVKKFTEYFQIIHVVGKNFYNYSIEEKGYHQFEFLKEDLFDIFKITDFAITRAGANSIYEFLALDIPTILIPLGTNQSRGDQIQNANYFKNNNFSKVINEEKIQELTLPYLQKFYENIDNIKNSIKIYKENNNIINNPENFYNIIISILEEDYGKK